MILLLLLLVILLLICCFYMFVDNDDDIVVCNVVDIVKAGNPMQTHIRRRKFPSSRRNHLMQAAAFELACGFEARMRDGV
jgi:hypothetical protein